MQDFVNHFFEIDNNTSATIIITISVFLIGILINLFLSFIQKVIERKNIRRIFLMNVKALEKNVRDQSVEFKKFSDQFCFEYTENLNLKIINFPQVQIIKQIGYGLSYDAFFKGLENIFVSKSSFETFNEIWETVYFLESWKDHSNIIKDFNASYKEYNFLRNKALAEFQKSVESDLTIGNINSKIPEISNYYTQANEILISFQKLNRRIDMVQNMLVQRFLELNRVSNHSKIPMIVHYNYNLLEASLNFENLKNLIESYKSLYLKLTEALLKRSNKLNDCFKILNRADFNTINTIIETK